MLKNHQSLRLKTIDNQIVEVEINFNNNPKVVDSQVLKFKYQDKEFQVSRDELLTLMLVVGDSNSMKQLLPMQTTKIRKFQTELTFEFDSSKDYKKGDKIQVKAPYIIEIPETDEILAGNAKLGKNINKIH